MNKTKKSLITGLVSACFVFLGGLGMSANTIHAVTGEPDPSATKLTITNKTGKLDVLKYTGDTTNGNGYIKYRDKKYTKFEYDGSGSIYVYTGDLKSNHGHISSFDDPTAYILPRFNDGHSQYETSVKKLDYSDDYNMILYVGVSGLDQNKDYAFTSEGLYFNSEPAWYTTKDNLNMSNGTINLVNFEMPVHFVNYYPTRKVTIKAKKNKKIRTYTSTGKFSKKYVYGKHNYKVTSYKKIKNHGTCYKLSGKNQYIPKKYLKFR